MLKIGDNVVIARQPKNQCVRLVGEIGIITEICDDGLYTVECYDAFKLTRVPTGTGRVPPECLELLK